MKNAKSRLTVVALLLVIIICAFASCNGNGDTPGDTTAAGTGENSVPALATPGFITVDKDGLLSWSKVDNAVSYKIEVDGVEYGSNTNSTDIRAVTAEAKVYSIRIMALSNKRDYANSEWSEVFTYSNVPAEDIPFGDFIVRLTSDGGYSIRAAEGATFYGEVDIPETFTDGKPIVELAEGLFKDNAEITHVTLPSGLLRIENEVFQGCTALTEVNVPGGVTKIGDNAFRQTAITELVLPANVREIGDMCFAGASSLETVVLPTNLQSVGKQAFYGCSSLKALNFPRTLDSLGQYAIVGCPALETLTVEEGCAEYYSEGNCIIRKSDGVLLFGCSGSVIPSSGVTEIEGYAFYGSGIRAVVIPKSVKSIGKCAFYKSSKLESVVISTGVTEIKTGAFIECADNASVILPRTVATIETTVFYHAVIYTDVAEECPAGWVLPHEENIGGLNTTNTDTCMIDCSLLKSCSFSYGDGIPYVHYFVYAQASYDLSKGVEITAPYRAGYTLLGWATDPKAAAADYPSIKQTDVGDLGYGKVLYAVWQKE